MRFTWRRKLIAGWVVGLAIPTTTSFALAGGFLDSGNNWDAPIKLVAYRSDCGCQPAPCQPCQPESMKADQGNSEAAKSNTSGNESTAQNEAPMGQPGYTGGGAPGGMMASSGTIPGYLDPAQIQSRIRVRYDDYHGANEPTRAEMFYPAPGNVGGPGPSGSGANGNVDFRQLSTYVEVAMSPCFSAFGEFPVNWVDNVSINNQPGTTESGFGDIKAGVRYGLIACPDEWLTAQVRVWAPSGDAGRALGVGHTSIDTALLYEQRLNCNTSWWYELDDWQTIDAGTATTGDSLEANVAEYGVGVGYDIWQSCGCCRPKTLTAVFEVVGWTVLDGKTTPIDPANVGTVQDARGDTIVNGKYGLRYNWNCDQTVYVGYGNNWTEDRWYSSIFRIEYSYLF